MYDVDVTAYLLCDSALVTNTRGVTECVDLDDLHLVNINSPQKDVTDHVGDALTVAVSVGNRSYRKQFEDVDIIALIADMDGTERSRIQGRISQINIGDTVEYVFLTKYTVPALKDYQLIVYLPSLDNYTSNDTLVQNRHTDQVGIKDLDKLTITMEQNIPNPAKDNITIRYSVPSAGEVNFKIYSTNGQLLYNKAENASFGKHELEVNTSHFASGIYFYTMEFEGQRITKRMSIKR